MLNAGAMLSMLCYATTCRTILGERGGGGGGRRGVEEGNP